MGSISRRAHPAEPALISRPSAVSPASPQENFLGNFARPVLGRTGRPARPRPDLNPSQALRPPPAFRLASLAQPPPETRPEQGSDFAPPAAGAARVSPARSWRLAAMPGANFAAQSRRSPYPVPVPER